VQARAFSAVRTDCAQPCLAWSYPPRSSDSVGQGTQISCSSVSFCRPVWFIISGARVERQLSGSAIVVGNELPGTGTIVVSGAGQGVFRSPDGLRAALSRLELSSSVVGQCRPRNADQLCANGHATAGFAVWVDLSAASVACVIAAVITVSSQWGCTGNGHGCGGFSCLRTYMAEGPVAVCSPFVDHNSRAELADTPNQYEMRFSLRYIWGLHSILQLGRLIVLELSAVGVQCRLRVIT
jgi:hypothetical protein